MKLVSFDVWNTLLDINVMLEELTKALAELTKKEYKEVFEKIMEARGKIKELRKSKRGNPEKALEESQEILAKKLGCDVEIIKRAAAKATLRVDERIVIKRAVEGLKAAKERGLIIITTGNVMFWPSAYTRLILERFGLADFIDKQFYSDELKAYKPMREVFLKPLEYFGVKPEEALHIGDTYAEDFEGALNAGLWAVWINPDAEKVERIAESGFVVRNAGELGEVLEKIKI
ncbi:HAD family hydrolase [Thermococcus sp. M39]|uniref:HAD family hydrolase n=1 Tax=unclassified Thermococcus TaxID=2627626 RepID=UPI00143A7D03|nr:MULTISPECIES: HAD family hydrolase [unclassified Thermococcus]NJE08164.1 HAD family hydrolase [Thermococcus sp. M39]NJE11657.1 HAD family hydrolase [Thermococcus sp. LS2]